MQFILSVILFLEASNFLNLGSIFSPSNLKLRHSRHDFSLNILFRCCKNLKYNMPHGS